MIGSPSVASLALHAAEFRGFNDAGGGVTFAARDILLDNSAGGASPGAVEAPDGTLSFDANTIRLGSNQLNVDQYATLELNASGGVLAQASGGLSAEEALSISAPVVTGANGVTYGISAGGALTMLNPGPAPATVSSGLGPDLTFLGTSIAAGSNILAPSGSLTLHATTGDVVVSGNLSAAGTEQTFFDVARETDGGQITLTSDAGNVTIAAAGTVTVAASPEGGNAGTVAVSAPLGSFMAAGSLQGQGGAGGRNGSFSLDVGSLPSTAALDAALNAGSFTQSRSIRVRTGDVAVDGVAIAQNFNLSADAGSITVDDLIDASGVNGGVITLDAYGSVTLLPNAILRAAGAGFNDAGEGGTVSLEAGSETNGSFSNSAVVDIQAGSSIDLSIAGGAGGALHLRAPQNSGGTDLAVNTINGSITGASGIVVEGYTIFDASDGSIDNQESNVMSNGQTFGGNATAIANRIFGQSTNPANPALASIALVEPGAEIINTGGDLTLSNDWDLSNYRFGTQKPVVDQYGDFLYDNNGNQIFSGILPGILTLRASGAIIFNGSLSDGFGDGSGPLDIPQNNIGNNALYLEALLPRFQDGSAQASWSYNITSGADFAAADSQRVLPVGSPSFGANGGSVLIGQNGYNDISSPFGTSATVDTAIDGLYQVIRTGAGSINVSAGGNVELLNQFATIYTAGAVVADPTMQNTFDVPVLSNNYSSTWSSPAPEAEMSR